MTTTKKRAHWEHGQESVSRVVPARETTRASWRAWALDRGYCTNPSATSPKSVTPRSRGTNRNPFSLSVKIDPGKQGKAGGASRTQKTEAGGAAGRAAPTANSPAAEGAGGPRPPWRLPLPVDLLCSPGSRGAG